MKGIPAASFMDQSFGEAERIAKLTAQSPAVQKTDRIIYTGPSPEAVLKVIEIAREIGHVADQAGDTPTVCVNVRHMLDDWSLRLLRALGERGAT